MKECQLFSASANNYSGNFNKGMVNEFSSIFNINEHIKLLEFDLKTEEEKMIELDNNSDANFYYFIYNLNDSVVAYRKDFKVATVGAFQSLVYFHKNEAPIRLFLQANKSYKFCVIKCTDTYLEEKATNFKSENPSINMDWLKNDNIIFCGPPNLNICEQVRHLLNCKKEFPFNLIAAGYVNIIIGLKLSHFLDIQQFGALKTLALNRKELQMIQQLSESIRKNPELSYSVSSLAKHGGLAVPKLQNGFKEMYGFTVSHFIREVRLEKAEQLIKNSDLNISEIVYSVGLTSRSYFSRIFKKKYNCSPSTYQQQQFQLAETA